MTGTGRQSREGKYFLGLRLVRDEEQSVCVGVCNQLNVIFALITCRWVPRKGAVNSVCEGQSQERLHDGEDPSHRESPE